jgi:hypothetical protein
MSARADVSAIDVDRRAAFARLADGHLDAAYRIAGVVLTAIPDTCADVRWQPVGE